MKPLGQRVLIKRDAQETKTKGGIYLPEKAQDKQCYATVIALGTGDLDKNGNRKEFEVNPGDRVITTQYGGVDVTVDGEKMVLVHEGDILAIID